MADDKPENEGRKAALEAAKDVALDVYRDSAKGALQQVGEVLTLATRVAVSPLLFVLKHADRATQGLFKRTEAKLTDIPEERLLLCDPTVSGPVILNHALLGEREDVEELRDLYASLLASTMDPATSEAVHPSYAHIISQMTATEARIVKLAAGKSAGCWAMVFVQEEKGSTLIYDRIGELHALGSELGLEATAHERCIASLIRLGLFHQDDVLLADEDEYAALDGRIQAMQEGRGSDSALTGIQRALFVTQLGRDFIATCVR